MVEHHIQRDILQRLMHAQYLRFSELKPRSMESNIFMYHVRSLQRAGYIAKDGNGYILLPAGLSYVDTLQMSEHLRPPRQPKVIAILALQNTDGQWLLVTRKSQPYINQRMLLSGQQHFDESMLEQAERELYEKGMMGVSLVYRGVADIQICVDDKPLTHVIAHIHHGTYDGALPPDDDQFTYAWYTQSDIDNLMAGTSDIFEALSKDSARQFALTLRVPATDTI